MRRLSLDVYLLAFGDDQQPFEYRWLAEGKQLTDACMHDAQRTPWRGRRACTSMR